MFRSSPAAHAKDHIRKIREDFGVHKQNGPSRKTRALERALDILSDQLYQSSTHFLSELIQNADDNEYDAASPCLTLTLGDGQLRVHSNERGFTEANVEAICRIGDSTKKNTGEGSTRYIGEKGIGFKSVFTVAHKVWISSRAYTFYFDKSATLGMIAPVWDESKPSPLLGTDMVLELSPGYDESELRRELTELDPRMLIFLRKLRHIKIVYIKKGAVTWQTELRRTDGMVHGEVAVQLLRGSDMLRYVVCKYPVARLPEDARRQGVRQSEIVLAFRIPDDDSAIQETEKTYAFLPIRDYGFKFLIQADFLLSASREEILTCAWNRALRTAISTSFVTAVRTAHRRFLLHRWPQYLTNGPIPGDFFGPAVKDIRDALRADPIVLDYDNKARKPSELFFVPPEYRENRPDGKYLADPLSKEKRLAPLLLSPITRKHYLSDSYSDACEPFLKELGVRTLSLADFVRDVVTIVTIEPSKLFQTKSSHWHTTFGWKLVAALLNHDDSNVERARICSLPIILMSDGGWVSPEERGVYLPCQTNDAATVDGVGIRLVDSKAAQDRGRASLYEHLGVKVISNSELCQHIASIHQRPREELEYFTLSELVSQISFLYKSSYHNGGTLNFWFKDKLGVLQTSYQLYIPSVLPYSASHYFGSLPSAQNRFLHEDYLKAFVGSPQDQLAASEWLAARMKLAYYVRLFDIIIGPATSVTVKLAPDFLEIVQRNMQPSWLLLLRDNWRTYSRWIDFNEFCRLPELIALNVVGEKLEAQHEGLLKALGNINVPCLGGGMHPLCKTYLPLSALQEDNLDGIPLLDIPDPENPLWDPLKYLGLGVAPDLVFYMRCLEQMSESSRAGIYMLDMPRKVGRCLDQIQARYSEDPDLVKIAFRERSLIPTNSARSNGSGVRWTKSTECLWEASKGLRHQPPLKRFYPGNATLFREVLGIVDAGLKHLRIEARSFSVGDDLEHFEDFFLDIERMLDKKEGDTGAVVTAISKLRIFPVINPGLNGNILRGYSDLVALDSVSSWFVADRKELFDSFVGLIPLVAFKVEHVQELKKTFEALGVESVRLSHCAQSRPGLHSVSTSDSPVASDFRGRAPFLLRLIPAVASMQLKRRVARRLKNLEVYKSTNLTQEWSVSLKTGNRIQGRSAASEVVFAVEDETLKIYLASGYMKGSTTKPDLVRNFADFCDIPNDRRHLLMTALLENHRLVEKVFADYGIGPLDPAIDSAEPVEGDYEYKDDKSDVETLVDGSSNIAEPSASIRWTSGRVAGTACAHCHAIGRGVAEGAPPGLATGLAANLAAGLAIILAPRDGSDYPNQPGSPGFSVISVNEQSGQGDDYMDSLLGPLKIFGLTNSSDATHYLIPKNNIPEIDPGIQYRGQEFFSRQMARLMGNQYRPTEHWTSSLRTRAGYTNFEGSKDTHAAFTIADSSGKLTKFMMQQQPELEAWLLRPPMWHFEVETTEGGLESEFYLNNSQVERVRRMSLPTDGRQDPPLNIVVLIRITMINTERPSQSFFRDPWAWFLMDRLKIRADTVSQCTIEQINGAGSSAD